MLPRFHNLLGLARFLRMSQKEEGVWRESKPLAPMPRHCRRSSIQCSGRAHQANVPDGQRGGIEQAMLAHRYSSIR
jgi:hypothetical protein